jgi:hypothetical protein
MSACRLGYTPLEGRPNGPAEGHGMEKSARGVPSYTANLKELLFRRVDFPIAALPCDRNTGNMLQPRQTSSTPSSHTPECMRNTGNMHTGCAVWQ